MKQRDWRVTTCQTHALLPLVHPTIRVTVERLVEVEGTGKITYFAVLGPMTMRVENYELLKPLFDAVGAEYVEGR